MAVIQKVQITISIERDIDTIYWFYKLYPPTGPSVPTKASLVKPATKGGVPTDSTSSTYPWYVTEPAYTNGDTKSLYVVSLTYFTDGTSEFSDVSVSSSYEASKQAYSEAQNAKTMATNYITYFDEETGIQVHNVGDLDNFVQMNADEICIYKDNMPTLSLTSEDITVGDDSSTHIVITSDSLGFWQNDSTEIMSIDTLETSFRMGGYIWIANDDRLTLWG